MSQVHLYHYIEKQWNLSLANNSSENLEFRKLKLVGGHPSLDLLNTVKYRGRADPQDRLGCFEDIANWAALAGLIDDSETQTLDDMAKENPVRANNIYLDICRFRENLRQALSSEIDLSDLQKLAVKKVEKAIEELRPTVLIDIKSRTLSRRFPIRQLDDLKNRLVQSTAELMELIPTPKIGVCAADDCDWLFIDRSKAKRRRWCDTKTCGNRARVRQFRVQNFEDV